MQPQMVVGKQLVVMDKSGELLAATIQRINRKTCTMEFDRIDSRYGRFISGLEVHYEMYVDKSLVQYWIDNPIQLVFADFHSEYRNR